MQDFKGEIKPFPDFFYRNFEKIPPQFRIPFILMQDTSSNLKDKMVRVN